MTVPTFDPTDIRKCAGGSPTWRPSFPVGLVALSTLLLVTPAAAQVRYTLAPSAEYTWWDKGLFLEDREMYGGRFGADFGRLVGLSAYYHKATDLAVFRSQSGLLDASSAPFADLTTDLTTFGANLMFKLGIGRVVPFALAGAGVMQFEPSGRPQMELINYRYGGGIQYDVSQNIRAQAYVADSRVRLDPEAFTDLDPLPGRPTRRSSWTAGASLGFALGGSLDGGGPGTDNWSFASLPIEPFVGRLDWDDPALSRQVVAGIRTGVDVGPHFGLRATYWQGRSAGFGERQPIQSYGAEARFNLTSGLGPAPYLIAGASRLDFEKGFVDADSLTREDETALVLGGGVSLRMSDQFRLNVSARDYIRSERRFDDVSSLDDLTHNWMLTAGLGFDLGRSRSTRPTRKATEPESVSLPEAPRNRVRLVMPHPATDTLLHARMAASMDSVATTGQVMVIPVPANGEIYVRFGNGASPLRSRVLGQPGTDSVMRMPAERAPLTETEMDELVRRLTAVLERMMAARPLAPLAATPRGAVRPTDDTPLPILRHAPEVMPEEEVADTMGGGLRLRTVSPFGGLSFGSVTQLAAGVRADAGSFLGVSALRLVPVAALGIGGQASIMAELGIQLRLPSIETKTARLIQPHVRLGFGGLWLTDDGTSRAGLNFSYGVTFDRVGSLADDGRPRLFVEHQGIDMFAVNRFVVGLTWKR